MSSGHGIERRSAIDDGLASSPANAAGNRNNVFEMERRPTDSANAQIECQQIAEKR
jgi:hypothetical protein